MSCAKNTTEEKIHFLVVVFCLFLNFILFFFLSAVFAFLENGPNLIYRNKLEISMEKL